MKSTCSVIAAWVMISFSGCAVAEYIIEQLEVNVFGSGK